MNKAIKTAKGIDGRTIRVGDMVISIWGISSTVKRMWNQGKDGAIIEVDIAPNPEFPHHWTGRANKTWRLK